MTKLVETEMRRRVLFLSVFLAFVFLLSASISSQQKNTSRRIPQRCPLNPELIDSASSEFGLIPHTMDLSHLSWTEVETLAAVPSAWDWRDYNGVTPAKDQRPCPVCWAFAATGALEARVSVDTGTAYDYSEQNMKECHYRYHGCQGGMIHTATAYLTTQGTVLEECDPYIPESTGVCNSSCPKIIQVTGWRLIGFIDFAKIKDAIYQYGPIYATMYASFPGFNEYDGSYVLYYTGEERSNHAVMIVGWDDNMPHAGGTGAWICKNSYGTDWGDNGFFYIAYGSARIGGMGSYCTDYKDYDYSETLYHYDEGGWSDSYGFGSDDTAWGLVKFTANGNEDIHAVDFWVVSGIAEYTIYIYDDFDGSNVSNLRHIQSGNCTRAGYYSIPLTSPVSITAGDDFVVVVKIRTPGYNYPIPTDYFDTYVPIESGKCYMSPDSSPGSWTDVGVTFDSDIGIRARAKPQLSAPVCTIEANGSGGPLTISQNEILVITVSLDPADYTGDLCDWWLVYKTPFSPPHDWYHYDVATKSWQSGLSVSHQSALRDISSVDVLNQSGFIPGSYTFYFGVDLVMNGIVDKASGFFDRVKVTVTN